MGEDASGWTLASLNAARAESLRADLRACCSATAWGDRILAGRPYPDRATLDASSDSATLALDDAGLAEALAGHPRIGAAPTPTSGGPAHGEWSRQEQSGMRDADSALRDRLAAANAEYERRFGHVYLVCATGLDASQLLQLCLDRLEHDPDTERAVVLGELAKINRLRLAKLLGADR